MLLLDKDMTRSTSRLRQRLWAEYRRLGQILRTLQRAGPMIPGSFYCLHTKCGKPSCRCARGHPHSAWVLTRSEQGRSRLYTVAAPDRARLRRLTAEYRRFQRARARWVKLSAQLLRLLDAIEAHRVQPWPQPSPRKERKKP